MCAVLEARSAYAQNHLVLTCVSAVRRTLTLRNRSADTDTVTGRLACLTNLRAP